jgi:hypothetical protein
VLSNSVQRLTINSTGEITWDSFTPNDTLDSKYFPPSGAAVGKAINEIQNKIPTLDTTLSISGAAADAAAVGEAIASPKYVAQNTAPEDTNLLWIDTSDEVGTIAEPKTEIILKSSTAGSTK